MFRPRAQKTPTPRASAAGLLVALGALLAIVSCESAPYEQILAGKACTPDGKCATGYVCAANVCVPEGGSGDATGSTSTGSSTSSGMGGSGGSQHCTSITDCKAPPNLCETPVCIAGDCGTIAVPSGTPLPADEQKAGDCELAVCDGLGHIVPKHDDADLPVDATVCTEDLCTSGVPSHIRRQVGAACAENGGKVCDAMGVCVECLSASDCTALPADNECRARACNAGKCELTFTDQGTAVAAQTAADCKKRVCDGAGAIIAQAEPGDLPDDGNDCTTDTCLGMTPQFTPKTSGATCMAGTCNSVGQCIGCTLPTDCSGTDSFCGARTCDAGTCGFQYATAGTALPAALQASGDCQRLACNGVGGTATTTDDSDTPADDGASCTSEICSAGTPLHPPLAFDTPCTTGGSVCDGVGACVQCNHSSQCPNTGTVCQDAACSSNQCVVVNRMTGAPADAGAQTTGDCAIVLCDGSGHPTSPSADDADLPVDGNTCTNDLCANGVPSNPPAPGGTACGAGGLCDGAGNCTNANKPNGQPCVTGSECASQQCVDGVCCGGACGATCEACSGPETAAPDGTCGPIMTGQDPDAECPSGQTCSGSGCAFQCGAQPTPPGGACPMACTGGCANGVCIIDCNAAGACSGASIVCPAGFDCQVLCGGANSCANATVACPGRYACDVVCSSGCTNLALGCDTGVCSLSCGNGTACSGTTVGCGASTCAASCNGSSVFPTVNCGASCDCTTCALDPGEPCTSGAQCLSTFCPVGDNVCCSTSCGGTCSSCVGAETGGVDGVCGFVKAGTDPENECVGAATCNGQGACQLKPNGASCTAGTECQSGICPAQDGVCCATSCTGTCQSCDGANTGSASGTCAPIASGKDPSNECAGSATCNGMGGCTLAPNGATCNNGSQCQSGNCPAKDHVCCATSCTGLCQSCVGANNGGMNGTCGPITSGLDPDNDCPGQPVCNGAGACN
ncbi:MAG: hypothetical protein U0414_42115 [Polyangiaceae bacterium]